jgi:hypothetical protein
MMVACFWMSCLTVFLELAYRAPLIEECWT